MELILASASPRRRELLGLLGLQDFKVCLAQSETAPDPKLAPGPALEQVALAKALEVQAGLSPAARADSLLIGADTMVFLAGRLLGKPRDLEEAAKMLAALSGNRHSVYTALALVRGPRQLCAFEKTDVYFRPLDRAEILSYLSREQVLDKAGAYAIQGPAAAFVERIEGDFFNVVGLPLCRLGLLLREMGLNIF